MSPDNDSTSKSFLVQLYHLQMDALLNRPTGYRPSGPKGQGALDVHLQNIPERNDHNKALNYYKQMQNNAQSIQSTTQRGAGYLQRHANKKNNETDSDHNDMLHVSFGVGSYSSVTCGTFHISAPRGQSFHNLPMYFQVNIHILWCFAAAVNYVKM